MSNGAEMACVASARNGVGVVVINMVVVGFMPRRTIDQTFDLRKGQIERISCRSEMHLHYWLRLYRRHDPQSDDLGEFQRERRPEHAAVARQVEAVARGVDCDIGVVVEDRDRNAGR